MQLLEDEPELTEKLGEVPVAVIEKGKVAGAHLLSGANVTPRRWNELFPDLRPGGLAAGLPGGDQGRDLLPDLEGSAPAEAAAAQLPQRRQLRRSRSRNWAASSPRKPRRPASTSSPRPPRPSCWSRTGSSRASAPATAAAARTARSSATSSPAPTSSPRRRCSPRARSATSPTPPTTTSTSHGADPQALGARGEGGLGGHEAARPGHPHDGLAAAQGRRNTTSSAAASSTRWARTSSASASSSASTTPTPPSRVHDALQQFKTHPFIKKMLEGGKRVGWGAKTIPSGGYFSMPKRLSVPGHGDRRRRREHGQRRRR